MFIVCSSFYLIIVIVFDCMDECIGVYGLVFVDLVVFGKDVFIIYLGGSYGWSFGIFFVSFIVVGIIGLLYSVICFDLSSFVYIDFGVVVLEVKFILFNIMDVFLFMAG